MTKRIPPFSLQFHDFFEKTSLKCVIERVIVLLFLSRAKQQIKFLTSLSVNFSTLIGINNT